MELFLPQCTRAIWDRAEESWFAVYPFPRSAP